MDHVDRLEKQARDATSLHNFGAASYREGLETLVRSLDEEANLNEVGRISTDRQLVGLLSQRLQLEDWYRRHPEINDQEINAPLIGLGLPRTGSTALGCLLAEDPAVRFIRFWEYQEPCPPPQKETEHTDPRIAKAEAAMAMTDQLLPRMKHMLPLSPTAPMECQTFMAMDFKSQMFQASARIPSYVQWFENQADLVPTYRYVKKILKLLQWRCPPTRWRLKNPSHILFIDALDQVFPDARYWMTHRSITAVLPSVADLYYEMHKPFTDEVDKLWLGNVTANFCEVGMRRTITFREAGNDHRFFDIHFAPFQENPFPDLEKLYRFLGEELTDTTRKKMSAWLTRSTEEKRDYFRNDPAEFGLDFDRIKNKFYFYNKKFQITS